MNECEPLVGGIHHQKKQYEQAVEWTTKAADDGLPIAMAGGLMKTSARPTFLSLLLLRILSGAV